MYAITCIMQVIGVQWHNYCYNMLHYVVSCLPEQVIYDLSLHNKKLSPSNYVLLRVAVRSYHIMITSQLNSTNTTDVPVWWCLVIVFALTLYMAHGAWTHFAIMNLIHRETRLKWWVYTRELDTIYTISIVKAI